jgi:hypothetical protein
MRGMGQARRVGPPNFPLIGVTAEETVFVSQDTENAEDRAPLESSHTHAVLVPGQSWGDESSWLSDVATVLLGSAPSVTLLTNGGDIGYEDAALSLEAGQPVLVLEGTGRAEDAIARAARGEEEGSGLRQVLADQHRHVDPTRSRAPGGRGRTVN